MSSPKVGEKWTLSLLLVSAVILSGFSYPVVATFCNTFLFAGSCNPHSCDRGTGCTAILGPAAPYLFDPQGH